MSRRTDQYEWRTRLPDEHATAHLARQMVWTDVLIRRAAQRHEWGEVANLDRMRDALMGTRMDLLRAQWLMSIEESEGIGMLP